jgi:hypothetical protein
MQHLETTSNPSSLNGTVYAQQTSAPSPLNGTVRTMEQSTYNNLPLISQWHSSHNGTVHAQQPLSPHLSMTQFTQRQSPCTKQPSTPHLSMAQSKQNNLLPLTSQWHRPCDMRHLLNNCATKSIQTNQLHEFPAIFQNVVANKQKHSMLSKTCT